MSSEKKAEKIEKKIEKVEQPKKAEKAAKRPNFSGEIARIRAAKAKGDAPDRVKAGHAVRKIAFEHFGKLVSLWIRDDHLDAAKTDEELLAMTGVKLG